MSKTLVAYFSASGKTARLAKTLANALDADLCEIVPEQPYSASDLDWRNKQSRSTYEMTHKDYRPAVKKTLANVEDFERIFVGFPVWWYVAPTIVNSFLEQYDLTGKVIIPFATSGGSGIGNSAEELEVSCKGAKVLKGKRFESDADADELRAWAENL